MVIGTDGDGVNDADEGNLWADRPECQSAQVNLFGLLFHRKKRFHHRG